MRADRPSTKKGRPIAERPKSREETPKLGYECDEACQRTRIETMSWFGGHRNLNAYCISTLVRACIRLATTYVTIVYLIQHCRVQR